MKCIACSRFKVILEKRIAADNDESLIGFANIAVQKLDPSGCRILVDHPIESVR
jgi:hypothetical protein